MRKEDYVEKGLAVIQKRPFARMDKCPARRLERTLNAYLWSRPAAQDNEAIV